MIKKDRMIDFFNRRHVIFISDLRKKHSSYNFYYRKIKNLKKISKYIPFPCKFNSNGSCNGLTKKEPMCCCNDCYESAGYFRNIFEQDIAYYARLFSTKTGFWRKGKGCILPREKRSITCLTFYCKDGSYDNNYKLTEFGEELSAYKYSLTTLIEKIRYEMRRL